MARPARWHGFLNIDKPLGVTSTDVVRVVRRLAQQPQVGHGGTLDPLATGVLPIALGAGTRLLEFLQEEEQKRYLATVRLGASTSTDDAEGEVIASGAVPPLPLASIEAVLEQFRGSSMQVPPQYAAIRVNGKRMYEYARAGEIVEVPPRPITIYQLTLQEYSADTWLLDVLCSKGTYIRALARDIGAVLGCGAHLTALRRTQAGPFELATAITLEQLETVPESLQAQLLPLGAALQHWPQFSVDDTAVQRLYQGQQIEYNLTVERAAVFDEAGQLVALVRQADPQVWQPFKVFKHNQ